MNSKTLPLVLSAAFITGAGCTFPSGHRPVSRSQVGQMQTVELGTVTSARVVEIEGEKSQLGLIGGGVVGAAAAKPSPGDSGRGGALVQAAGTVAGAVVGQAVEEVATRQTAQEIKVRLDDGRFVVVTQETSGGLFQDGDRVHVLHGGGGARVTLATN
jgi:outer membrane lipoprotein SlyB